MCSVSGSQARVHVRVTGGAFKNPGGNPRPMEPDSLGERPRRQLSRVTPAYSQVKEPGEFISVTLPAPAHLHTESGMLVSLLPRCGLGYGVSVSPVCSGRLTEAGSTLFTSPKCCVGYLLHCVCHSLSAWAEISNQRFMWIQEEKQGKPSRRFGCEPVSRWPAKVGRRPEW